MKILELYLENFRCFDKVPFERLLKKLEAHRVGGRIKNWIAAWLRDRRQRVTVNVKKMAEHPLRSSSRKCTWPSPISDFHQRLGQDSHGKPDHQKFRG